jgi:hypothetical protein
MEKYLLYFLPLNCARDNESLPLVLLLYRLGTGRYVRANDLRTRFRTLKWPEESELGTQGCSAPHIIHIVEARILEHGLVEEVLERNNTVLQSLQTAVSRIHSTNWQP